MHDTALPSTRHQNAQHPKSFTPRSRRQVSIHANPLLLDVLRTIDSMTSATPPCRFGGPTFTPQSHGYGTNPSWLKWTVSVDDCRGMALHPPNQDQIQLHAAMAALPHLTAVCALLGTHCSSSLRCSARFLLTPVDQARLQAHNQVQSAGTQQSMSSHVGWPR